MALVMDRYPGKGSPFNVLKTMAQYAWDDGSHACPSMETIARRSRLSERQTQRVMKRLRNDGWLLLRTGRRGGLGITPEYAINIRKLLRCALWCGGDFDSQKGDTHMSPLSYSGIELTAGIKGDIYVTPFHPPKGDIHMSSLFILQRVYAVKPIHQKGDTHMSPIGNQKGDISDLKGGTHMSPLLHQKGDTHMSPNITTTTKHLTAARARDPVEKFTTQPNQPAGEPTTPAVIAWLIDSRVGVNPSSARDRTTVASLIEQGVDWAGFSELVGQAFAEHQDSKVWLSHIAIIHRRKAAKGIQHAAHSPASQQDNSAPGKVRARAEQRRRLREAAGC